MAGDPAFQKTDPPTPAPTPAPAAVPQYVTVEQFNALRGQMQQFADQVIKAVQKPAAAPAPAPQPSEVAQRLLENPDAVFNEKMAAWYKANVAPVQTLQMNDTADRLLAEQRTRFDSEFGAGAFDKLILPGFQRTLEQVGDQRDVIRANAQSVSSIVESVKGQNFNAVLEARTAHQKALADATPPAQPPYLVGHNMGPRPAKGELTPAEQLMVDKAKHVTGDDFKDMPELMAMREAWGAGALQAGGTGGHGVSVDATAKLMQNLNGAGAK